MRKLVFTDGAIKAADNEKGSDVHTNRLLKKLIAGAILSGVGAAAGLGLAAGTASADGAGEGSIDAWSNFEWCPGDPIMQSDQPVTWDWNVCHFWHYQSIRDGAPSLYHVVEGIRPSQCPPLAWMCP